ncbi:MAG: PAS domain-containing protein [Roseateles sp.]|uniref:PAS domain-containing protein n=1 Tax=Roseateles sp. TaxID=1971397 RepID=UPI00403716DD
MQVRRLMLWGMALAFGLVALHQVAFELLERQRERIDAVQLAVGKVSRDAAGLLVLTQDYLLHGHGRARRQWHAVYAEVSRTLRAIDGRAMGLDDDIVGLLGVSEGLQPLFAALESAAREGAADADGVDARRQMLSDHLVAETRRISEGAFDLAGRLIDLRNQQQRRLRIATLAANALLTALLAGLVAVVMRRVLRPMRQLQDTARRIEGGELQARSAYAAPDEFGSLSQSFDAMTQALQDRQAALEATRRDLRTVLDAVPSVIGYWDRNLNNRVANRAHHTWFGADPDTLPGRNMRDLLGPTLFEANRPYIEAALRGEPQTFERSISRPDGLGLRHTLAHYLPDRQGDEVQGFYVIVHDLTELNEGRLQLAAALGENEALLAAIQQYSLFSEMDPDGRFITVNDNVCRLSGFSREELLGKTYAVHRPQLASGDFDSEIWPALRAGRAWQGEIGGVAKDGSVYWTYAVMVPVRAADGSIRKYVSIRTDITAQKRLAQEAQRINERFELAAGAAGIGVWDYDVVARTLVWDDQMYALYGRHRSGGLEPYTLWSESVHSEDRATSEQALQVAIDGHADFEPQFRIVRPDGEERQIKAMARVVRDAAGRPLRMIGVNFDVTDRLRTEAALQANESLLRSVGRMALVGGWRVDLRGGRLHWSEQTRAIHEVPADFEPTLETAITFYAPESRPVITDAVSRSIASGQGWDLELRLITHTGRSIWVRAMGEVEFDAQGKPAQLVGAFQDITERRRMDDLLRPRLPRPRPPARPRVPSWPI